MPYKNNSDKAEDNKSSAWVLLIFGVLGIIAVILGAAGIIPLKPGNPYMFYGIMGAVFILFIVMGIISMKNAIFFAGKAASDNTLQETMIKWCIENLNASDIDKAIGVFSPYKEKYAGPKKDANRDTNKATNEDTNGCTRENAEIVDDTETEQNTETGIISEEELYFKRYEYIKNRLKEQFMNLDEGFLDNFIDEKVFAQVFER